MLSGATLTVAASPAWRWELARWAMRLGFARLCFLLASGCEMHAHHDGFCTRVPMRCVLTGLMLSKPSRQKIGSASGCEVEN